MQDCLPISRSIPWKWLKGTSRRCPLQTPAFPCPDLANRDLPGAAVRAQRKPAQRPEAWKGRLPAVGPGAALPIPASHLFRTGEMGYEMLWFLKSGLLSHSLPLGDSNNRMRCPCSLSLIHANSHKRSTHIRSMLTRQKLPGRSPPRQPQEGCLQKEKRDCAAL